PTGASSTTRRRSLWPGATPSGTASRPSGAGSTPRGASPTPTPSACWARWPADPAVSVSTGGVHGVQGPGPAAAGVLHRQVQHPPRLGLTHVPQPPPQPLGGSAQLRPGQGPGV